jgi:hypothetical protein
MRVWRPRSDVRAPYLNASRAGPRLWEAETFTCFLCGISSHLFHFFLVLKKNSPLLLTLDSSVGIATGYGLEGRGVGVRVPVVSRLFSSPRRPEQPTQWVPGVYSPGVKRLGREAGHSPPLSAEVKNSRAISPLPHKSSPPIHEHATSALDGGEWSALPRGNSRWYPLHWRLGGLQSRSGRYCCCWESNLDSSVVQPVAQWLYRLVYATLPLHVENV